MMLILVQLVGLYILVMGIILLFSPKTIKRLIAVFGQGKRLYLVGLLRVLIGAVLLLAASRCKLSLFVAAVGIVAIIVGMMYFTLGLEKIKAMLSRWDQRPVLLIRFWGLVAIAVGALLLYSV